MDPEAEKSFVSFVFSQVFLQKSKSYQLDSKLDLKFEHVFHLIKSNFNDRRRTLLGFQGFLSIQRRV